MTNEESDFLEEKIKDAISTLAEHFDTVQIFCSLTEADTKNTNSFQAGTGNWFARKGQIQEWVDYQRGRIEAKAFDDQIEEEDEE